MWQLQDLNWRQGVLWLAVFAALLIVGAALFVVSGVYNVAASVPHLPISNRLIAFTLRRSVETHSAGIEVPDLSDEGLVRLGAVHFRTGCAPCHGSEAQPQSPLVTRMLPSPPPLHNAARDWETGELFWIVRHGLKLTGMPAWPGRDRDDEVWALVAYLERLHEIEGDAARPKGAAGSPPASRFDIPADVGPALCAACHGDADRPPVSGLVPALQGQSADYLRRALREYREGLRESGMMEPIAAALTGEQSERIVARYAAMEKPPAPPPPDPASVERGREIARRGIEPGNIPPCLACHSRSASPRFPRLAGMSQAYIANQLDLFSNGVRDRTAYGVIMTTIARRLSSAEIEDVAAYFAQADMAASQSGAAAAADP